MAWGGVPPVWLLLRHTVCAPRRRGVRGCICCAPACLLFLHCCVYLEFSVSSASDKDAGSAALRVRQGRGQTFARTRPCSDNPLRRRSKSAIRWGGGFGCLCPRRPEATTSVTNHAELLRCCVQEQRRGGHVVVTVGRHA